MSKKLHYFDINGIAEGIRYILHYTKQKFEDIRYDVNTWPHEVKYSEEAFLRGVKVCKAKYVTRINLIPQPSYILEASTLPYHQLPLYEEDGRKLIQSIAIAKYVARGTGLVPDDPWEQALVECGVQNLYEFWEMLVAMLYEEDPIRKEERKKELFEETIPFYFSRFERDLKENGGYFAGKLSWGEFVLITIVESTNLFLKLQVEKDYPTISARIEEIRNAPGVKEYIAAKKPYVSHYTI